MQRTCIDFNRANTDCGVLHQEGRAWPLVGTAVGVAVSAVVAVAAGALVGVAASVAVGTVISAAVGAAVSVAVGAVVGAAVPRGCGWCGGQRASRRSGAVVGWQSVR